MARSYAEDRAITAALNAIEVACSEAYRSGFLAGKQHAQVVGSRRDQEPTYCSGSTPGKLYTIADMPTRYIRNVLAVSPKRQAAGLVRALEDELARRTERDGSLRDER